MYRFRETYDIHKNRIHGIRRLEAIWTEKYSEPHLKNIFLFSKINYQIQINPNNNIIINLVGKIVEKKFVCKSYFQLDTFVKICKTIY